MKKMYVLMFYSEFESSYEPVFASDKPIAQDVIDVINKITIGAIKEHLVIESKDDHPLIEYTVVEVPCPLS